MADSDKTLKILIELGVVGEADVKAASDLVEKTGAAAGKAGEGVEKLEGHSREFHHIAGELNRVLPGLGEGLMLVRHGGDEGAVAMIGMSLAIGVLLEVNKKLTETAKQADEAIQTLLSEKGSTDSIDAMKHAWEEADVASEVYYHNLNRRAEESAEKLANLKIEQVKREASEAEETNSAAQEAELAGITEMENNGVLTHQEAEQAKFAIDLKYVAMKLEAQRAADAAEQEALKKALGDDQKKQGGTDQAVKDAETKNRAAQGTLAKHNELISTYKENITTAKDAAKQSGITPDIQQELGEAFEKYTGGIAGNTPMYKQYEALRGKMGDLTSKASWSPSLTTLMDYKIGPNGEGNLAAYETAQNDIRRNTGELKTESGKDYDERLHADNASSDLVAARKDQEDLKRQVKELQEKIGQMTTANAGSEQAATTSAFLKTTAEAAKSGETAVSLQAIATAIAGHNANWQSVKALMDVYQDVASSTARDIAALQARAQSAGQ